MSIKRIFKRHKKPNERNVEPTRRDIYLSVLDDILLREFPIIYGIFNHIPEYHIPVKTEPKYSIFGWYIGGVTYYKQSEDEVRTVGFVKHSFEREKK